MSAHGVVVLVTVMTGIGFLLGYRIRDWEKRDAGNAGRPVINLRIFVRQTYAPPAPEVDQVPSFLWANDIDRKPVPEHRRLPHLRQPGSMS